jgi:hypothetical protein
VHFDTESCDVLLFEFTSKVALDEGGLTSTTVTNKDELEGWCSRSSHGEDSVTFENGKKSRREKNHAVFILWKVVKKYATVDGEKCVQQNG